ncbi:MAG: hypothetical protein R3332_07695 [Pseudohongiellaceae bacterium]|nr:hypothetical protein [Pseudohongiellaceae bacterium]
MRLKLIPFNSSVKPVLVSFPQPSISKHSRLALLSMVSAVILAACQSTTQTAVEVPERRPVLKGTWEYGAMRSQAFEEELAYQRKIADLLYDGIKALNDNRLLTPPDISAHAYFSRVLAIEPNNEIALKGIQDIVVKYLQLAAQAGRQGQFDSAETYLNRASQVDARHEGIAPAWAALEAERNSTDMVLGISARDLASQSSDLIDQLEEIAVKARDSGAFVLITAPNDSQGRWIYAQMQAAVQGHRLRGNIELGESPTIRLVKQTGSDA